MADVVPCSQCGLENRLGLLFCGKCGAKLDLSRRQRSRSYFSSITGRYIRIAVVLFFLAVLGLLCWPVAPVGDAPAAGGAQSVIAKARAMRAAVSSGNEIVEQVDEAQINHYITTQLVKPRKPNGFKLHLRQVRLDIKPGHADVWMRSDLYALPVTYTLSVHVNRREDGSHVFVPGALRIGHLPLPGPVKKRALDQIAGAFSRFSEEMKFITIIPEVTMLDGSVRVSSATAQTPKQEEAP